MPTQMSPVMRSAIEAAQRELAGRFRGVFSAETISRVLEDSYQQIGERPTVGPNFMPIFVREFARERLEAVAQAEGLVAKALPEVLFICVETRGAARWPRRSRTSSRAVRSLSALRGRTRPRRSIPLWSRR